MRGLCSGRWPSRRGARRWGREMGAEELVWGGVSMGKEIGAVEADVVVLRRASGGRGPGGDVGALGLHRDLGRLGEEAFSQQELLHFARRGERELLEHGPVGRRLVRRE